ncbi:DUF1911 domain-containing protein [Curvibacter sp. CHRR-16]|uniref:PoNe immunity protein domain-containing protein n=1 Tax=Curvibacter sp. CHRR-16 TaxID=2835872 RepID=UPI001BD99CDD|nr:PoNe immunity protein domain-containing protein [Curvibacter sp. CHRR-16]MBT0571855.1 DUF1911 domain-containing protein [Curvibacter sp. CHRR-16]
MSNANQVPFIERRRQPFITEAYSSQFQKIKRERSIPYFKSVLDEVRGVTSSEALQDKKDGYNAIANALTDLLHLRYTAGEPIEQLRTELDEVVAAWEDYAKAVGVIGPEGKGSIFGFAYRVDYNKAVHLAGLAVLLRREDLLPRIDAMVLGFKGSDAVYEELVSPYLPERPYADTWYHATPYTDALNAIDSEDPKERSALMGQAVEDWFAANEGQPFHGTHKDVDDSGEGGYTGYWCFELAALCFIKGIDDSAFRDHLTYPKDLVDFARSKGQLPTASAAPQTTLSAQPGQPVPRAGVWQTTALLDKRSLTLALGEKLPFTAQDKAGNAVVWFWKSET